MNLVAWPNRNPSPLRRPSEPAQPRHRSPNRSRRLPSRPLSRKPFQLRQPQRRECPPGPFCGAPKPHRFPGGFGGSWPWPWRLAGKFAGDSRNLMPVERAHDGASDCKRKQEGGPLGIGTLRFEPLNYGIRIVDTTAPRAAADLLQGGPESCVLGQGRVGCEIGMGGSLFQKLGRCFG